MRRLDLEAATVDCLDKKPDARMKLGGMRHE